MDTLEFFKAILPSEGVYYLALIPKQTNNVAHKAFNTIEELTAGVEHYAVKENLQVYHACSTYKEPFILNDGKRQYRVASNSKVAKSIWLDLDCGDEKAANGDGYPRKKDACVALLGFCKAVGLPTPLFIDSGNGVHAYWPLDTEIDRTYWQQIANQLKVVLDHHGVLHDSKCTTDFARVLRPIGAVNRKGEPKPVKLISKSKIEPINPSLFYSILSQQVEESELAVPTSFNYTDSMNDDLTSHAYIQIPHSAEKVATKCQQIALMRDTKGDVGYEHWRGVIGIIKHCTEGVELAHHWSENRAATGHDQTDTNAKYESWNSKPTTCAKFESENPGGCDGCQFKGKINTPIVLGREAPEPKEEVVEAIVDGEETQVTIPELPTGYGRTPEGILFRYMPDKEGIEHAHPFCYQTFYPIYRVRMEDGTFGLEMRLHLPDGRTRDFQISQRALASPAKLTEALSDFEVVTTNNKDSMSNITAYLKDSLQKLMAETKEINTYTSFGWKDDYSSFLIGNRLYHKDGSVRKVLLGSYARQRADDLPEPRGTAEEYAEALNFLYARPDCEHRQYSIASDFGSVLVPFADPMFKGLLFAITGEASGRGKTTLARAGLFAFGDAEKMSIKTDDGATVNARYARIGTYQNLPILLDEITRIEPSDLSKMCYRLSLGEERDRLSQGKSNKQAIAPSVNWALNTKATGNSHMHGTVARFSESSTAEAVRLIEIRIDRYPMADIKASEVAAAMRKIQDNMGSAGDKFVRHVVANRDAIIDRVAYWLSKYDEAVKGEHLRYYRWHGATSLAAIEITNKLGITKFDLTKLYDFTVKLLLELAAYIKQNNTLTAEDAFDKMISILSPRIISTYEYRDGRDGRGPEEPVYKPYGDSVVGRYIMGSQNCDPRMDGKLYISRKVFTDWCSLNRVDSGSILSWGESGGIITDSTEKFTLGRGSTISTGNTRCIRIDYKKYQELYGAPNKFDEKMVKFPNKKDSENVSEAVK